MKICYQGEVYSNCYFATKKFSEIINVEEVDLIPCVTSENRIAQYSFTPDGKLVLYDIWPNYLKDTFKGQTGYIYYFKNIDGIKKLEGMDNIYGLDRPIEVENVEVIPDIYEEIVKLNKEGLVELVFYEDMKQEKRDMFSKRFLETYKKTENPLVKEVLFDKFKMIQDYENSLKEKL